MGDPCNYVFTFTDHTLRSNIKCKASNLLQNCVCVYSLGECRQCYSLIIVYTKLI